MGDSICVPVQDGSEFLGVILGVAFLCMVDFSTHLCACGDVYGSEGILHSLIVWMGILCDWADRLCFASGGGGGRWDFCG